MVYLYNEGASRISQYTNNTKGESAVAQIKHMGKSGKGKKMSKGSAIILILVMIIAIATGIGTYSYLSVQTVMVYLFNDGYKAGTPVTADMFSSYSLPVDLYNAMSGTGNSYATVNEITDHINNADALLVDVAKYGPVFSNQFLSGGGTGAEIRLGDKKVAVELPADRIQGLGADIRIGSRLNIITSYSIDYYKYTEMIFQNLLVVDITQTADGEKIAVYVEVDPSESLELLHAIAFETVQAELVKPGAETTVPSEDATFYRSYQRDDEDSAMDNLNNYVQINAAQPTTAAEE